MSYKPQVRVGSDPKWCENSLCFATEVEALENAKDLMMRWMLVTDYRANPSKDKVTDGMLGDFKIRTLRAISREIQADWKKPYFGAVPYLQAMSTMDTPRDHYGADDGKSIVLYFLSNAKTWRGDVAKRVKLELKGMI